MFRKPMSLLALSLVLMGASQTFQTLYALYDPHMRYDFHDITVGSNGFGAYPGYDLATGLGTPYAHKVIFDLATYFDGRAGAVGMYAGSMSPAYGASAMMHAGSQDAVNGLLDSLYPVPIRNRSDTTEQVHRTRPDLSLHAAKRSFDLQDMDALFADIGWMSLPHM